jgi:hypothetical protein
MSEYYNGYHLIETTAITKVVQRRTHRRRRINKKWAKRYGYHEVLDNSKIIISGDCIYGTPKMVRKIIVESLLHQALKGADNEQREAD